MPRFNQGRISRRVTTACIALLWVGISLGGSELRAALAKIPAAAQIAAADGLFTNPVVRLLQFHVPRAAMNSLRRDPRTYVHATFREGGTVYTNVMVRLKGGAGSFRPLDDKPGLTIKLEGSGGSFHGLKKFHLNNSVQDSTYLSEWVCSEIFRQAGVPTPRALPVLVELNGRSLGICVLLESVDGQFLGRAFKNTEGNVYSPQGNSDVAGRLDCVRGKENDDRTHLKALAAAARNPGDKRLAEVLDVDRFISFMAVEVMLCHWDGYTSNIKNYLLYDDLDANKMVFIPHDLDQMLQDPNRPIFPRVKGVVARAILADPVTRKRYLVRFGEIYSRSLAGLPWAQRIDAMVARLAPGFAAYSPALGWSFAANANGLKARILNRVSVLQAQLRAIDPSLLQKRSNSNGREAMDHRSGG